MNIGNTSINTIFNANTHKVLQSSHSSVATLRLHTLMPPFPRDALKDHRYVTFFHVTTVAITGSITTRLKQI